MADKTFLDEVDQIDLELDVSFNEFDDESQHDTISILEPLGKQSNESGNTKVSAENVTECCLVDNNVLSLEAVEASVLSRTTEAPIKKQASSGGRLEEGEVISKEEEMELLMDTEENTEDISLIPIGNGVKSSQLESNREDLKRKIDDIGIAVDAEANMDIDDNLLLGYEDVSMSRHGKKCKKEKDCGNDDTGAEERKKLSSKSKKKKKHHGRSVKHRRIPRPFIGRLFRPLIATENDVPEVLAIQLADRLEEKKEDLLVRVLKTIGNKKGLEIFRETKEIQVEGGMRTAFGDRKRTSGGIFIHILKNKGYATEEQLKEIFAAEREKVKQLIKEQKKRDKELRDKGIYDLRQNIAGKHVIHSQTKSNDLENGSKIDDVNNEKEEI